MVEIVRKRLDTSVETAEKSLCATIFIRRIAAYWRQELSRTEFPAGAMPGADTTQ
jgi:hypothetical protein